MNESERISAPRDRERLDRILCNSGYGTRREARRYLRMGRVTVDGQVVRDFDARVELSAAIAVDGERVPVRRHLHLMLNKPAGYVCSAKAGGRPTVFDLLGAEASHKYLGGELALVGRLDADTEGLLLLTTDGGLNHALTSPRRRVPKTYLAYLRDAVPEDARRVYATRLAAGMRIAAEGREPEADCLPAECVWRDAPASGGPAAACELTVYEGKFHEVRRLFAALGNEVVYLKRLRVGGVWLDEGLGKGCYRELSADEVAALRARKEEAGDD